MCLAAPAYVIAREGDEAIVDLDGVRLRVSAVLTPDIAPGEIGLIHVGFILSRIDQGAAEDTLAVLRKAAPPMSNQPDLGTAP